MGSRVPVIAVGPRAASEPLVEEIRSGGGVGEAVWADPAQPDVLADQLAPAIDRWGCPESLVIAVSAEDTRGLHEIEWAQWQAATAMVLGTVGVLRTVVPLILATANDGVVVVVQPSTEGGSRTACLPALMTGALDGLCRALRLESSIHTVRWYWVRTDGELDIEASSAVPASVSNGSAADLATLTAALVTASVGG